MLPPPHDLAARQREDGKAILIASAADEGLAKYAGRRWDLAVGLGWAVVKHGEREARRQRRGRREAVARVAEGQEVAARGRVTRTSSPLTARAPKAGAKSRGMARWKARLPAS